MTILISSMEPSRPAADIDLTMESPLLSPRTLVADLLASSLPTANAFLDLRVDCIGCSMNKFCTLEDVSRYYGLDMDHILETVKDQVKVSMER
jgi:hypothetical protein